MNNFKITALGALATIGLASAAIAQPKVDHQPDRAQGAQQQEREMQGDMSGMEMSGMMAMMNDPEMRAEMMEMMRNCNEMMKKKQEQMSQSEDG